MANTPFPTDLRDLRKRKQQLLKLLTTLDFRALVRFKELVRSLLSVRDE